MFSQAPRQGKTVQAGQNDVREDDVGSLELGSLPGLGAVRGHFHVVVGLQHLQEKHPLGRLVLHEQETRLGRGGRFARKLGGRAVHAGDGVKR